MGMRSPDLTLHCICGIDFRLFLCKNNNNNKRQSVNQVFIENLKRQIQRRAVSKMKKLDTIGLDR